MYLQDAELEGVGDDELCRLLDQGIISLENQSSHSNDSWQHKTNAVIEQSRAQIEFGAESQPVLLAQCCLLDCNGVVEKAVDLFVSKWNEKVCIRDLNSKDLQ